MGGAVAFNWLQDNNVSVLIVKAPFYTTTPLADGGGCGSDYVVSPLL